MEIVNFIRDYWQYFSVAILLLLEVISWIIKKRPVDNSLNSVLVSLICEAEENCSTPKEKLSYVLDKVRKHTQFDDLPTWYIAEQVEKILETPTKKGGYGREKTK